MIQKINLLINTYFDPKKYIRLTYQNLKDEKFKFNF